MKKLLFLFLLLHSIVYSQEKFVKGYIVGINNTKFDCLFENSVKFFTSNELRYKLSEESDFIYAYPKDLKEFGVEDGLKVKSILVDINEYQSNTDFTSTSKEFNLTKGKVFLEYLVEGEVNLLRTVSNENISNFYLEVKDSIELLLYKKYNFQNRIREISLFKSQIAKHLTCNVNSIDIENLKYKNELIKNLVIKHNLCVNKENTYIYENEKFNKSELKFNFYANAGLKNNFISVSSETPFNSEFLKSDFSFFGPTIGFELELLLPVAYNKFSLFINPNYSKSSTSNTDEDGTKREIDLSILEVNCGVRYYFKKPESGLFINSGLSYVKPSKNSFYSSNIQGLSTIKYENMSFGIPLNFGLGYILKNKYTINLFYVTSSDIFKDRGSVNANLNSLNFQLGYKIF